MVALTREHRLIRIDGRPVYALVIRLPKGLRVRMDEWDVCAGVTLSVAIPPEPARRYYVHESAFANDSGWWVQLVDAPELPAVPAGGRQRAG